MAGGPVAVWPLVGMVTTEAVVTKATSAGAPLICWGRHRTYLDASLALIVEALANDQPLEPRHHDHALSGEWGDHHDCHVKPDLVLICQKSGADTLRLVRLGSHAELGLARPVFTERDRWGRPSGGLTGPLQPSAAASGTIRSGASGSSSCTGKWPANRTA